MNDAVNVGKGTSTIMTTKPTIELEFAYGRKSQYEEENRVNIRTSTLVP